MAANYVSNSTRNVKGPYSTSLVDALVGVCVYVTARDCSTDVGAHANALPTAAGPPSSKLIGAAGISVGRLDLSCVGKSISRRSWGRIFDSILIARYPCAHAGRAVRVYTFIQLRNLQTFGGASWLTLDPSAASNAG